MKIGELPGIHTNHTSPLQPVYLMPGMAADPRIFEYLRFPKEYDVHWLSWKLPYNQESLQAYACRMCEAITHNNPILIGVSFGGVLVQEMSKIIKVKKLIIISSIKTHHELPPRMKFARDSGIYKYLPTGFIDYLYQIDKLPVGNFIKKRIQLYKTYLSMNDKNYLDWSIKNIVCWQQDTPPDHLVHIHGDQDLVFPIKYIKNCEVVHGGTHIMILNRFRWFNEHLVNYLQSDQKQTHKTLS